MEKFRRADGEKKRERESDDGETVGKDERIQNLKKKLYTFPASKFLVLSVILRNLTTAFTARKLY